MNTWRDSIRPRVARVLAKCREEGLDYRATRRALRKANPFLGGPSWQYRVWCSEVRHQLDGLPRKASSKAYQAHLDAVDPRQMRLFD